MSLLLQLSDKIPFTTSGLAFGIIGLGWNWEKFHPMMGLVQIASALLALFLTALTIVKLYNSHFSFYAAIRDANIGPVSPTISLVLMLLSVNLTGYFSEILWLIGVLSYLTILVVFVGTRYRAASFSEVAPSWFIPFVAIAIAAFTNPGIDSIVLFSATSVNQIIMLFAIACYFVILPVILYKIKSQFRLSLNSNPSLVLFAAPANLCLLGYLEFFKGHFIVASTLLLILAMTSTLFSYFCIFLQRKNEFTPAISSYTFPLVIGAPAMLATSEYLQQLAFNELTVSAFAFLAQLQLYAATFVTLFVLYRYVRFIYRSF